MKLLRSRLPYMTDEDWTDLVNSRVAQLGPDDSLGDQDPLTAVQTVLVDQLRFAALGFSMPEKIDRTVGMSDLVNEGEARAIRDMYWQYKEHEEDPGEAVAMIFNVAPETVEKVMEGSIWPYAGGVMKPLVLSGINPETSAYTSNQRAFVRSALKLAQREFSPVHFEIICNNNGMKRAETIQLIRRTEIRSGREFRQRYRDILVRHAAGGDVEKCIASQRRRARKAG